MNDFNPSVSVELAFALAAVHVDLFVEPIEKAVRSCIPDVIRHHLCEDAELRLSRSERGFRADTLDMRPRPFGDLGEDGQILIRP